MLGISSFLDKTQLVEQTEQIAQSGLQELIKCKLYLLKSNVAWTHTHWHTAEEKQSGYASLTVFLKIPKTKFVRCVWNTKCVKRT